MPARAAATGKSAAEGRGGRPREGKPATAPEPAIAPGPAAALGSASGLAERSSSTSRKWAVGMCDSSHARRPAPGEPSTKRQSTTTTSRCPRCSSSHWGVTSGPNAIPFEVTLQRMRAMVLDAPKQPLQPRELPDPEPAPGQVLIDVHACAVCRTDLHIVDGELTEPKLPLVPGHQIVGRVLEGRGERFAPGDRVAAPWLGWTDGACRYCLTQRE